MHNSTCINSPAVQIFWVFDVSLATELNKRIQNSESPEAAAEQTVYLLIWCHFAKAACQKATIIPPTLSSVHLQNHSFR